MSTALDPTIVQPIPTGAEDATDVGNIVVEDLTRYNLADIAADHESRIAFGEKKYGQRLKTYNGRDAIMDSYQELLDFLSYAKQAELEGKQGFRSLFQRVAVIAEEVRSMLHTHTPAKPSLTFIPNAAAPYTTEERIRQHAERLRQDPDNIIAVPFSELEGNLLHQVPSHLTIGDEQVPFDVAGEVVVTPLHVEDVTELGEHLVEELDSFDTETPETRKELMGFMLNGFLDEVIKPAHFVGDGESPVMLVDSEETMTKLEKEATGAKLG